MYHLFLFSLISHVESKTSVYILLSLLRHARDNTRAELPLPLGTSRTEINSYQSEAYIGASDRSGGPISWGYSPIQWGLITMRIRYCIILRRLLRNLSVLYNPLPLVLQIDGVDSSVVWNPTCRILVLLITQTNDRIGHALRDARTLGALYILGSAPTFSRHLTEADWRQHRPTSGQ